MVVLRPDKYLLPDYKISPFSTHHMKSNSLLSESAAIDDYFGKRFAGKNYYYTINGRSAIHKALECYNLKGNDAVTILTTSGNFYVSSCVTSTIEKFCKWNREVDDRTKVILVVHEFGYPFNDFSKIKSYNLPIVEDAAYAFFSTDDENTIGNMGDFCVYSFPKMFPLQIGGLLTCRNERKPQNEIWGNRDYLPYIKKVMSYHIAREADIIKKRRANYSWLQNKLGAFGFSERFSLEPGVVPGVCMFNVPNSNTDLQKMRDYFFQHGIQCSVFYGERAFFIPLHQDLSEFDLEYFIIVTESFLQ
jgi:hypothetical protein